MVTLTKGVNCSPAVYTHQGLIMGGNPVSPCELDISAEAHLVLVEKVLADLSWRWPGRLFLILRGTKKIILVALTPAAGNDCMCAVAKDAFCDVSFGHPSNVGW